MTWYLVLAIISATPPHTTAMIKGPFETRDQCEQYEIGVSKRFCVVGCVHSWHAITLIDEFVSKPKKLDPTCESLKADVDF
jgi:hypothetical protein